MALQSSADRSIFFTGQKITGHMCIFDAPNECLSFAFAGKYFSTKVDQFRLAQSLSLFSSVSLISR